MHTSFPFRLRGILGISLLLAGFVFSASAQSPAAQPASANQAPSHTPEVTAKINTLAHSILNSGMKSNALSGDDLMPWHLKMDIQLAEPGKPKPLMASLEEWSMGRYQWKRIYTSHEQNLQGSELSVARFERYRSKPSDNGFDPYFLNLRAARPVIDPLYQAAGIKPDYELAIQRINTGGMTLNCVAVADPSAIVDIDTTNPDYLFPAMCFDDDSHLRLTSTSDTKVQFEEIQPFQNRAVARDIKVVVKGTLVAEMKVTLLEPWTAPDATQLQPGKGTVSEPYRIEPGMPQPESVHEEGFPPPPRHSTVLSPGQMYYSGVVTVPIVIKKDGSVKVDTRAMIWVEQPVKDAAELAINRWKYKPYLVDGQPVEVGFTVHYNLDKPFVPSYNIPKVKPVATAPDDFSSAYDPRRNPVKDLLMAEAQAKQANKHILLEVGGDWCGWCKILDKFFADHGELLKVRDSNFVLMKVNMSAVNENYPFLSQYPKIPGYPWLFVVDADGKLLVSKSTNDLENGASSYDEKSIKDFLLAWKP
jgi:hypothetical protein